MSDLAEMSCVPCRGGVPPLAGEELASFAAQVPQWGRGRSSPLGTGVRLPDFVQALAFTNRIGDLAESEGHHPDIYLAWGKVGIKIWTHKIDGLTESDFVLAAKRSTSCRAPGGRPQPASDSLAQPREGL